MFDCLLGLLEQTRTSCNGFRVTLICGSVFVVYFSIFQPNGLSRTSIVWLANQMTLQAMIDILAEWAVTSQRQ